MYESLGYHNGIGRVKIEYIWIFYSLSSLPLCTFGKHHNIHYSHCTVFQVWRINQEYHMVHCSMQMKIYKQNYALWNVIIVLNCFHCKQFALEIKKFTLCLDFLDIWNEIPLMNNHTVIDHIVLRVIKYT